MLNYDLHTGDDAFEHDYRDVVDERIFKNPFPGLRPFSIDESHLYFGRESQVDEVLTLLAKNRFVTIMGYSGSGKSSLMYCGLIPVLHGGFMGQDGAGWNIITSRPGDTPVVNLSKSILTDIPNQKIGPEELPVKRRVISSILRSNAAGLIEAIKTTQVGLGAVNTLIFIDQFEELFRFKDTDDEAAEEARLYVKLLLEACNTAHSTIYVALTMRSDYIGECASFTGLTQMINQSNYLIPQMSRDQKRKAIEGPVAVGGGSISDRLVKRLLNEMGDSQDQLPIMQHALMRTWDYWAENREANEAIDIRHYNAVGQISQALSQHANEAYDELTTKEKEIAEVLFKALTERTTEGSELRRSVRLGLITELAQVNEYEVIRVIDKFRQQGRSFLMPPSHVELHSNSIIEIAHESLMRIWTKLRSWVDEEYESAQMYRRLSDAATMYQIGRTGLWRPPDLQLALNWQKKQRPTRAWAQRYDEAFERAIVFLDTSRITYEAEQKNQEMLQRRLLRRTKVVAVVLGVAAVISILFFVYAITQSIEAEKQAERAEAGRLEADEQRILAEERRSEAEQQRDFATAQKARAENSESLMREALREAEIQKQIAERNFRIAQEQSDIANDQTVAAQRARDIAQTEYERAEQNYSQAQQLLYQSVAQSMAVKSLNMEDDDLKGLLAQQAYNFYQTYNGRFYDPYIYNGLYSALSKIKGTGYNTASGIHRNSVRSIVVTDQGYYSTGTEGRLAFTSLTNPMVSRTILSNKHSNRVLALSPNEQWLVNGSDSAYHQVINTSTNSIYKIEGHSAYINDIAFINNDRFLSVGGDMELRSNNISTGSSKVLLKTSREIKSIDLSPDQQKVLAGTLDGQVWLIDLHTLNTKVIEESITTPVHAVAFDPKGRWLAIGDESGLVTLFDQDGTRVVRELTGHKGRISDIEFSADGELMATASFDKTIQMWVTKELDELPLRFTDNDAYVWDIQFSADHRYLIAGCADGDIRLWPTTPGLMANDICQELKRNMTKEEWDKYIGNDIPYSKTCDNF